MTVIQNMNEARCPDGGILREVYKDPAWGQVNVRTVPAGQSKPGHVHHRYNETWILVRGEELWVTVGQPGGGNRSFRLPLWEPLELPAGTGHAVANLGRDEAVIVYTMDEVYDPDNPDKEPWE
jgi:dTDP-4-dehydrorhamnose 3,5-epimerase-like enzyme